MGAGSPSPGVGRADVSVKEQLSSYRRSPKPGNSIIRTRPSSTHSLPSERPSRSPAGQTADSRGREKPLPKPSKGVWYLAPGGYSEAHNHAWHLPSASQGVRPCQPGPVPAACSPKGSEGHRTACPSLLALLHHRRRRPFSNVLSPPVRPRGLL